MEAFGKTHVRVCEEAEIKVLLTDVAWYDRADNRFSVFVRRGEPLGKKSTSAR
jgi:hypothetical protein